MDPEVWRAWGAAASQEALKAFLERHSRKSDRSFCASGEVNPRDPAELGRFTVVVYDQEHE